MTVGRVVNVKVGDRRNHGGNEFKRILRDGWMRRIPWTGHDGVESSNVNHLKR